MQKFTLLLWALVLSTLLPLNAAVNYQLGPVGFEDGQFPSGWTQENVRGTVNWAVEGGAGATLTFPDGARSGSYRIAARGTSGQVEGFVTKLISPAINLTQAYNPQLLFSHAQVARSGYFDTLRVYYRTTASAPWVVLAEYNSAVTAWTNENIVLPSSYQQGSAYQIAFEISDHAGLGVVLDDIRIIPTSQCQDAYIQHITPTATTATIGMGSNGAYDNFEVVVTSAPVTDWPTFDMTTAVYHQTTDEFEVTVSGLTTYTDYYVYVRTDCSDNESGYTNWVSSSFKTPLLVQLPYVENFNTTTAILSTATNFGIVAGWTFGNDLETAVNVPYVYQGTATATKNTYSVDSTQYLAFVAAASTTVSAIPAGKKVYAISPELNGNLSDYEVDFWGSVNTNFTYGAIDYASELTVGVMSDPSDFASFTAIETVKIDHAQQFKHFHVSLANYAGNGKYLALVSMASKPNVFFVDNLKIQQVASPTPSDVRVVNMLPTGFDVMAQLHGADSWNIKVATVYNRDASRIDNSETIFQQTGITAQSFHVNLADAAGQTVMVYVQSVKNGVASAWSFPRTIRVPLTGTTPLSISFNTGTYESFLVKSLGNEIHNTSTTKGVSSVLSPLRYITSYPTAVTTTPVYDGAYLTLRGTDNYIVLPYLESLDSLEVNFRLSAGSATYDGASRVAVGVMTDPYDLSTFVELGQFDGPSASFVKVRQALSSYTGNGHFIAIRAIAPSKPNTTYGSYNSIDDIIVKTASNCYDAAGVKAVPGASAVDISWNPSGMTNFLLKVYSNSARTNLIASESVTTLPTDTVASAHVAGLTSQTTYYYTLQTICGNDTLPAEVYSFTTLFGLPYSENFDAGVPSLWKRYAAVNAHDVMAGTATLPAAGTTGWASQTVGATYVATSGKCLGFNLWSTNKYYWAVMPELSLIGETQAIFLDFDLGVHRTSAAKQFDTDDYMMVLVSTDGGLTWPRANAYIWAADGSGDGNLNSIPAEQVNHVRINLTQYQGQNVMIAFYGETTLAGGDNYVCIDNVEVIRKDINCQGLTSLEATVSGSNDADINWTADGTQSVYLKVTAAGQTTPAFEGTVTTSPYHLSGLATNTLYNIVAYQSCGTDTVLGSFRTDCGIYTVADFGTADFSSDNDVACWRFGVADTTGVGATLLELPTAKVMTGFGKVLYMEKKQHTSALNYGNNYYAIMPLVDVDSISHYQVVFDAATTTNASSDTANVHKLYVGVISDLSDFSTYEPIDTLNLSYAADSSDIKTFIVGFNNYMGDYMGDYGRYVMFQVAAPAGYSDIAVIDNVRLEPVSSCAQVTSLALTSATSTSLSFEWTGAAPEYQVMFTDKICLPDTTTDYLQLLSGVTTKQVTFNQLAPGTTYYAYVRAICAAGDSAVWSPYTSGKTTFGIPFLEAFDDYTASYINEDWKTLKGAVPADSVFTVNGMATSASTLYMSIQNVDSRISGMSGRAARTYFSSATYSGFLKSPAIDFSNVPEGQGINLRFLLAEVPSSTTGSLTGQTGRLFRVYVSEDGGDTFKASSAIEWNCDGTGDYNLNDLNAIAKVVNIDLSDYAGKSVALGFYNASTVTSPTAYIYIDSVSVDFYNNNCQMVTRLHAESENGGAAITWQNNTTGYVQVDVASDANFENILLHDSIVGDSIFCPSLMYNETYFARVKPVCADEWEVINFTTPYGLPFSEEFTSTTAPAGWNRYKGDLFQGTLAPYSGGWSFTATAGGGLTTIHTYGNAYRSTSAIYSYLLSTPEIVLNNKAGNHVILSLDAAATSSYTGTTAPTAANLTGHTVAVAISTDGGNTWAADTSLMWQGKQILSIPSRAATIDLDLTAYANQAVMIGFYHGVDSTTATSTSANVSILLDNIKINSINFNCLAPSITMVDSTETSVTAKMDTLSAAGYVVEISAQQNFATVLATDTLSATDSLAVFTGLTASSTYFVHAKKLCGDGEESGWSEAFTAHTACAPIAELPWSEGFESYTTKALPYCWNSIPYTSGVNVYPYVYLTAGNTGTHSMYLYGGVTATSKQVLTLPQFAADMTSLRLQFAYKQAISTTNAYGHLVVGVMSDPSDLTTFVGLDTLPSTGTVYDNVSLTLDAAPANHNYIAFLYTGGTSVAALYMDDITVSLAPQNETLKSFEANNVTRRSFDLVWEKKATCECNNYQLVISTTQLSDSALATANYISVDATSYSVTGLERGTTYYAYVRTSCQTPTGPAVWMSTVVRTRTLVDDIQVGNGTNAAYAVFNSYGNSYSQTLFTPADLTAMGIKAGLLYSISFEYNGATSASFSKKQTIAIGTTTKTTFGGYTPTDFVTPATLTTVFGPQTVAPQVGWITYEFNTPFYWDGVSNLVIGFLSNQLDGTTNTNSTGWATKGASTSPNYRSVYRYKDSTPLDPNDLAGTSTLGNRSYNRPNIRFGIRAEACPAVSAVTPELVGFGITEANIIWTASDGDYLSDYDVFLTTDSITPDSIVPNYTGIDSLNLSLSNLTAETTYYVYVRANCQAEGRNEGSSTWVKASFTTNANCMPVKDLMATVTGKRTAEVTWTKYIDEQDNNFRYVLSTTELDAAALAAATPVADTTMHLYFDSLTLGQTYYIYVRSYCGATSTSIWQSASFTMPSSCPAVVNLATTRISANAAILTWSHAQFAEESAWEVGVLGMPGTVQTVADTVATVFGLAEGTAYTAYVRAICAEGDTSAMTTLAFTTKVGAATECINVGTGVTKAHYAPFNMLYKNSWNQMIYTAEQIGQAGEINAISFHQTGADTAPFTMDNMRIFMAHTQMSVTSTTTDWVPESDLIEVFNQDNYVLGTDTGWIRIDLTNSFDYNGTDNLAVVVTKTAQTYKSVFTFEYTAGTTGVDMYRQNDSDPTYGTTHPGTNTGTRATYLPNAQFCYVVGGCNRVSDLEVHDVTTNSASVSWYPGGAETSWETVLSTTQLDENALAAASKDTLYALHTDLNGLALDEDYYFYIRGNCSATEHSNWRELHFITDASCIAPGAIVPEAVGVNSASIHWTDVNNAPSYQVAYGLADSINLADAATFRILAVVDTTATLTGLKSNTLYAAAVRAICAVGDTSRWSVLEEFRTECDAVTQFPWVEDFNSFTAAAVFAKECWDNVSVYEPATGTGSVGLMFKVGSYTTYGDKTYHLNLPTMRAGQITRLYLPAMEFDSAYIYNFSMGIVRNASGTTATTEGIRIFAANLETGAEQELGFISRNYTVASGTNVKAETAIGEYTYTFGLPTGGGQWQIILQGESQYSGYIYMDNFEVSYINPNCMDIEEPSASITSSSADINWRYNGGTTNAYIEVANDADFANVIASATVIGDSTYHVGNLSAATEYYVRVRRECGNGETSGFTTGSFTTAYGIPYEENFETAEGWMINYNQTTYRWMLTTTKQYVLGDMSGKVGYFKAWYSTSSTSSNNLSSRLYSPAITLPETSSDEAIQATWLMGACKYSTYAATAIDTTATVSFDIYSNGAWTSLKKWEGASLNEIPWEDADLFREDLTDYAGQTIKVGIRVTTGEISNSFAISADSVRVAKIYKSIYQMSTCSSMDYQDDYFSITRDNYNVGTTTEYKKYVLGLEGAVDTLVVLQLTVGEATETAVYDTICEGHVYDRNGVTPFIATRDEVRPVFLTSVNGCDSLVTVNISVIPAVKTDTTILACKGSACIVNGKTYYTSTVVTDTLQGVNTCDSIVRTFIYFSDESSYNVDQHRVICAGDTYTDKAFPNGISAAGTYTSTVTSEYGCDSTVTIHAIIANNKVAYDTIMVEDLPYVYAEEELLGTNVPAGTYNHDVQATCGAVTLYITVVDKTALDNVSALSLSVAPNPAAVGVPVQILTDLTFSADFRLTVFDAVGQLVMTSDEQTLTVPGMPVAGFYTVRVTNGGKTYQAKLLVK